MLVSSSTLTALCVATLLATEVSAQRCKTVTKTRTKTVTVTAGSSPTAALPVPTTSAPPVVAPVAPSMPEGATAININFGDYTGGGAEAFLNSKKFHVSAYTVHSEPMSRTFYKENVDIKDGKLQLTVKAGSVNGDVSSAEIFTEEQNMRTLNITTRAKSGKSKGVCSGMFTYKDDTQEADIEILTSYIWEGYGDAVPPGLQFTNQATNGGKSTNSAVPYPFDPTEDFHDYTVEWSLDATRFYVDGALWKEYTTNVPTQPSSWIINSWSSGDPFWSAGPPTEDNVFEVESITGWYTVA